MATQASSQVHTPLIMFNQTTECLQQWDSTNEDPIQFIWKLDFDYD